ncbi:MAG: hypothetical protein PHU23_18945 [Dehalococcoidales bacterium]|nr:hypothetical protein [Dehalococcoidales bacterium]
MEKFDFAELKTLMERTGGTHVSIYMPTHVGGGQNPQDLIRYKNLVQDAENQLVDFGLRSPEARRLLKPAKALQQNNLFWRQQTGGLALFLDADRFFAYYRAPIPLIELVVTSERFHIKPLLPLLAGSGVFYVLAVSQNRVRLLECTAYSEADVTPETMPTNITEVIPSEGEARDVLRFGVKSVAGGGDASIFRGTGISPDHKKNDIAAFFRRVDAAISPLLKQETAPLILAAVDYLQPLYRSVNSYDHLLPGGVIGNPDELEENILRVKALAIAEPYYQQSEKEAIEQYNQSAGTGLTSNEIKDIIEAAYTGRVKFLFVARGIQQWGQFNIVDHRIVLHEQAQPGDQDLLDLAAYYTLLNSGTIFVKDPEDIPDENSIAAVFHYWSPGRQI